MELFQVASRGDSGTGGVRMVDAGEFSPRDSKCPKELKELVQRYEKSRRACELIGRLQDAGRMIAFPA